MIVMAQMILFKEFSDAGAHGEVVRGIMDRVVHDVAKNEAGKHSERRCINDCFQPQENYACQGHADGKGHYEASAIAGIIVMNAMNEEVSFFSPRRGR